MNKHPPQTEPRNSLSTFDESSADGIARRAVRKSRRTQSKPPLVGREADLLSALRQAELAHEQALRTIHQQRVNGQEMTPRRRGRRPGVGQTGEHHHLAPLRAFITVLKAFWESTTGARFGYEVERGEGVPGGVAPKSAATRLVWEAAQYLEQDYTLANVGTVMRALQRGSLTRCL